MALSTGLRLFAQRHEQAYGEARARSGAEERSLLDRSRLFWVCGRGAWGEIEIASTLRSARGKTLGRTSQNDGIDDASKGGLAQGNKTSAGSVCACQSNQVVMAHEYLGIAALVAVHTLGDGRRGHRWFPEPCSIMC